VTTANPKKIAALAGHELSPNPSPMAAAIKPPTRADKSQESLKISFPGNGDLQPLVDYEDNDQAAVEGVLLAHILSGRATFR
jgi:hypothetical protein